jgi:probable rRNA maturation factor
VKTAAAVIDVEIRDARWLADLRTARALCRRAALAALAGARQSRTPAALAIALANDATVRVLNRDFRGKDKPTNVLSFPADARATLPGEPRFLGDIVLARQTVAREARQQEKRLAHHLTHLVVHGVLHLLDYDHETAADTQRMESLEVRILAQLGVPDPYFVDASSLLPAKAGRRCPKGG